MSAQQNNSNNSTSSTLDLIVIGGGINGAGIAADASGRGLNVGLYEANDFASATSS
ncbi:MAG TPA: glycerol-3-phosphate dehydrogenase, partial [Vibrio sp.]|nr:glycerol-3-phosphate dehydrogenase [Vibrio sp.]